MRYSAIAIAVLLAGCASSGRRSDRLISQVEGANVSEQGFRVGVREYGKHMMAEIARAAERIQTSTDDIEVRRNALRWKINAIRAAYAAVFNVDPVAGLIDVWAFTVEMHHFFEHGAGNAVFVKHQEIAIATSLELHDTVTALASKLVGGKDPAKARKLITEWATEHPIRDMLFIRESTNTAMLQMVSGKAKGTFAAVESMEEQLEELTYRLTTMAGVLPLLVEWQAELVMLDSTGGEGLEPTLVRFAKLEGHVAHMAGFLDAAPENVKAMVELQRDAAMGVLTKFVAAQLDDVLADVERQRKDTIRIAQGERDLVFQEIVKLRDETMTDLHGELQQISAMIDRQRAAILTGFTAEREAALAEAEGIKERALDRLEPTLFELFDHLAWRLAQIVAATAVAAAAFVLVVISMLRR